MTNTDIDYGNGVEPLPAGTVLTADGNGTAIIETINAGVLRLVADVSAVSGTSTPTLTISVQTSNDKGVDDAWHTVASFAGITATGKVRKAFAGVDRYCRVTWAITGTTPSFTLGIYGEAV